MKNLFKKEKVKIKAVYDKDLINFLKKIDLLEKIKNKEIKCEFCGDVITLENFKGVFKKNNQLKVFCEKKLCFLESLMSKNLKDEKK